MGRKAVKDTLKKEKIMQASRKCFFELGYEATSIRNIMSEAKAEPGLFYYYFDNKDDAYHKVIDQFVEEYKQELEELVERGRRDPFRTISNFFFYVRTEVAIFRKKYAEQMHPYTRLALRERAMKEMVPYLQRILEILVERGAKPEFDVDVAAIFLVHGAGSLCLHEDAQWQEDKDTQFHRYINMIMGVSKDWADYTYYRYAEEEEWGAIHTMLLNKKILLNKEESKATRDAIETAIRRREIIVVGRKQNIKGLVWYSRNDDSIICLHVCEGSQDPVIGNKLIVTAMSEFEPGTEMIAWVPEEEDSASSMKVLCQIMGFAQGEERGSFTAYRVTAK